MFDRVHFFQGRRSCQIISYLLIESVVPICPCLSWSRVVATHAGNPKVVSLGPVKGRVGVELWSRRALVLCGPDGAIIGQNATQEPAGRMGYRTSGGRCVVRVALQTECSGVPCKHRRREIFGQNVMALPATKGANGDRVLLGAGCWAWNVLYNTYRLGGEGGSGRRREPENRVLVGTCQLATATCLPEARPVPP